MKGTFGSSKFKTLFPYFLLALAIILAYRITGELEFFLGVIRNIRDILAPFFYGFILAYIINIPISGIQRLLVKTQNRFVIKRQKMFSVIIVFMLLAVIIALTLNLVIPAIADSVDFFRRNAYAYWEGILQLVESFNELALFGWQINDQSALALLEDIFVDFSIEDLMQPLNALIGVGMAIFTGVIACISSIYIMVEKDKFKKYFRNLLRVFASKEVENATIEILGRLNENFRQYIRTQTIDGMILGTMATIVLFAIGSPYALILGIMLGVVNYVPYFGSLFGTVVSVIVVIFTQDFRMGIVAAVVLFVVQQIDANIVQPRLMSGSFALSPLLVIIGITIGGAVAGIFGMIVAIPIVAVIKEIFDHIVDYYGRKKFAVEVNGNQQTEPDIQIQNNDENGNE